MSENLKLYDELEVQRLNLHDINEFLTNELKARALSAAELERQLAAVQAELETVKTEAAVSNSVLRFRGGGGGGS